MSMIDDKLEILIGKSLDGEISPAEKRWLDAELDRNEQARELFGQLQILNEGSRQVVASGILEPGRSPEDILERTWRCHEGALWRRVVKSDGRWRFAVGLAAGFLLGVMLHFALTWGDSATPRPTGRPIADRDVPAGAHSDRRVQGFPAPSASPPIMRNVDWYTFTDQTGNQWLVEGVREGSVRPAAYHGDL